MKEYEFYAKGMVIAKGTYQQIADKLGINVNTVRQYNTASHHKAVKGTDRNVVRQTDESKLPEGKKRCSICQEVKDETNEFFAYNGRFKTEHKFESQCKVCKRKKVNRAYEINTRVKKKFK